MLLVFPSRLKRVFLSRQAIPSGARASGGGVTNFLCLLGGRKLKRLFPATETLDVGHHEKSAKGAGDGLRCGIVLPQGPARDGIFSSAVSPRPPTGTRWVSLSQGTAVPSSMLSVLSLCVRAIRTMFSAAHWLDFLAFHKNTHTHTHTHFLDARAVASLLMPVA